MLSTQDVKRELARRVDIVRQPTFIESTIQPIVGESGTSSDWESRVIQLDGTGAATIEFRPNGSDKIFAKLYPDKSGQRIFEKLQSMRAAGFGRNDPYQVVEPLGFVPQYDMLLARGAAGRLVATALEERDDRVADAVMAAARWLARLHSWPMRIGEPISLLVSGELLSLSRRLTKVVAQRPEHLKRAQSMIRTMEALADETIDGIHAQSHGQYRPIHVFVGDAVTVIDLDRSRPCDPARDVAEFVHRLRMTTFWHNDSIDTADAPTRLFLETYASEVRDTRYLSNLRFHWARYIFHSLNHKLKAREEGDLDPAIAFYEAEFEKVVGGQFAVS